MSVPGRDNLVDTGRRSTQRSRETAVRWLESAGQVVRHRASDAQEFVRDRVRTELDALGVASRADLDRATEAARQAALEAVRDHTPTPVVVPPPVDPAQAQAIAALRDTMARGFELLAGRIEAVATQTKTEIEALRREQAEQHGQVRAGFELLGEEITGVGRATRRDLERVRNEMTQLEVAIREGTDRMVEALAAPRPLLSPVHDPIGAAIPAPIEIRPEPSTPVDAIVVEVTDLPRRSAHPEHPAGHGTSGRIGGLAEPGRTPPSPPAPVTPLTDLAHRSGRIGTPRWSAEPRPTGPIVDLSTPDPDEPPLAVNDLRTARAQPPG